VGGCQTGEAGSFARTKREEVRGTKIHLFEFGVKYLNFGARYLGFCAMYLNFGTAHLNFGAICLNFCATFVGGGVVGSPRISVIGVGEKKFA